MLGADIRGADKANPLAMVLSAAPHVPSPGSGILGRRGAAGGGGGGRAAPPASAPGDIAQARKRRTIAARRWVAPLEAFGRPVAVEVDVHGHEAGGQGNCWMSPRP